ncbi:8116_t:CDS:2, partial [Gigaspora margarita]
SRNSSNSKPERLQTSIWKFFTRGQSKGNGHWEGTCDYCRTFYPFNNLEDISTDEPFSTITLAFIIYGIPFHIINNPFFINALNLLNPSYSIPSYEVLSGCLLDIE